jgi:carbon monoxide dehydrogenase subunit G
MDMTNEFRVATTADRAWSVLTDVEKIAPCLPGAELQEVEGDEYRGVVKVKVGPITAQYKGKATFVERDDAAHRAVLRAEGRDTRGQGNASATITATLEPDGDETVVRVSTDLHITGKVAQFGRGVLADVSAKLMQQFADNLQRDVLSEPAAATPQETNGANGATASATPPPPPRKPAEPVDLMATAGAPVAKRALPVLGTLVFLALVFRWRRKRKRKAS